MNLRPITAIVILALAGTLCGADFPTNPGFELPSGWTAVGGGALRFLTQNPAEGKRCLDLRGWVLSDPAGTPMGGWLRVRLAAQPSDTEPCPAQLAVAFVTSDASVPQPQLSLDPVSVPGRGWRTLVAEMYAPVSPDLRLALGSIGEGEWLLDDISVTPFSPPALSPAGDAPLYPEPLPAGWEPEGTLDAVERRVAGGSELVVMVGGIEASAPPQLTEPRGTRGGLPLTLLNRGGMAKSVTISVQGPPGTRIPERTIPLRAAGVMVVKMSAQSLLLGEHWMRVQLRCGGDVKALPVRLTVTPAYPTLMAVWCGHPPPRDSLEALRDLGVGICQVIGSPQDLAVAAELLPPGMQLAAMVPAPWSADDVAAMVGAAGARATFFSLHHARGEAVPATAVDLTSQLVAALRADGDRAWALAPPVDVGAPGGETDIPLTIELGAAGQLAAFQVRLPPLQPATVRSLAVGRKTWSAALPSWVACTRQSDLTATAQAIRQRSPLPLFISELCATSSGSPELDTLSLARVLVTSAYQGATGLGLYARPEDCPPGAQAWSLLDETGAPRPVVAEVAAVLGRELSNALPLQVLQQDERVGLSPTAEVAYRPFVQGDQGVVAIWNNTAQRAELFVELRATPLDQLTIDIGPEGLTRSYSPAFRFCPEAHALGLPFVPVSLQPGHMVILSLQLMNPYVGWLGPVYYRPEKPKRSDTPIEEFLRRIQESRPH